MLNFMSLCATDCACIMLIGAPHSCDGEGKVTENSRTDGGRSKLFHLFGTSVYDLGVLSLMNRFCFSVDQQPVLDWYKSCQCTLCGVFQDSPTLDKSPHDVPSLCQYDLCHCPCQCLFPILCFLGKYCRNGTLHLVHAFIHR